MAQREWGVITVIWFKSVKNTMPKVNTQIIIQHEHNN